ncbi:hypothetical protein TVAG_401390 [Trichomonas vaginalis G3]|uniref:Uncharacterized protein n=1 Tax=Trichomonas vaginalis (strain ATCC PRA-98 / G3) TaxID=412133 RepID=A2EGA6_TRIV3|nr:putative TM nitroreductase family [Trichomonas vaginalis G3]EAY08285.1 hypothetical protein TVAG_401390 [Trichomonas vaginalis G3]KAI5546121.1 putative TM nitroreductase family [Trichomonas vaginalis G3]|eukprot:XP_001320508.1 hypothetical protein [Trichomonas vaginalis G3]
MAEKLPPMEIVETFKRRRSERNFDGSMTEEERAIVENIVKECNELPSICGTNASIAITEPGIGRFGFVKAESGWIVLKYPLEITDKEEIIKYTLDATFKASIAVLRIVQNHLGTVWIAGTYQEALVESRFPGFKIPCTVAFGKVAAQLSN